jgi:hypothetical protein
LIEAGLDKEGVLTILNNQYQNRGGQHPANIRELLAVTEQAKAQGWELSQAKPLFGPEEPMEIQPTDYAELPEETCAENTLDSSVVPPIDLSPQEEEQLLNPAL